MKKSKIGVIYITNEGNFGFDFGDKHYEVMGTPQLTELKKVLDYDKATGFLMVDTNYGEEFFEFFEEVDTAGADSLYVGMVSYVSTFLREALAEVDAFIIDEKRSKNPLCSMWVKGRC